MSPADSLWTWGWSDGEVRRPHPQGVCEASSPPCPLPSELGPVLSRVGVSCALRSSTFPLLPKGQEQTPPGDELVGSSPHPPSLRATLPRQVPSSPGPSIRLPPTTV